MVGEIGDHFGFLVGLEVGGDFLFDRQGKDVFAIDLQVAAFLPKGFGKDSVLFYG